MSSVAAVVVSVATVVPAFATVSVTTVNTYVTDQAPLYGPVSGFSSCSTGGLPASSTYGFVQMWNQLDGKVHGAVAIKNGLPNTSYDIYVNQDPGGCPTVPSSTVITNQWGYGNGFFVKPWVSGATKFWISAVGGSQVLRSPARFISF